jgi:hypothetical protein
MGEGASYFGSPPSAKDKEIAGLDRVKQGFASATLLGSVPKPTYAQQGAPDVSGLQRLWQTFGTDLDSLIATVKKPVKADTKTLTNLWAEFSMLAKGGGWATAATFKDWLGSPFAPKAQFGRARIEATSADQWTSFLKKNGLYTDVTGVNK